MNLASSGQSWTIQMEATPMTKERRPSMMNWGMKKGTGLLSFPGFFTARGREGKKKGGLTIQLHPALPPMPSMRERPSGSTCGWQGAVSKPTAVQSIHTRTLTSENATESSGEDRAGKEHTDPLAHFPALR